MTQDKDHKPTRGPIGPSKVGAKTLVGAPPLPSSRLPHPSENGGSFPPGSTGPLPRGIAGSPEATRAAARGLPTQSRQGEGSFEEISSSLLLPDDSSSGVMPGLEELSGSLLLEDPTEVRLEPTAAEAQVAARPQPAAGRRTVVGLPELPTSTPAPNLADLLSSGGLVGSTQAASAPASPENPPQSPSIDSDAAPTQNGDIDEATRVVPPPPKDMYEALKGYEATAPPAPQGPAEPPADTPSAEPSQTAPLHGDVEVTSLPRSPAVKAADALKEAFEGLRSRLDGASGARGDRPRWFLPGIALGGLVVGIAAVALLASLTHHGSDQVAETSAAEAAAPEPAATAPPPESARLESSAAPALAPPPAAPEVAASTVACTVSGPTRVVARSALVSAGIEVRAVGDDVALGFAPSEHEATALRLDPSSLAVLSKVDGQSSESIRRVVPLLSADATLSIAEDADREGDSISGRRTIPLEPPLEVGLDVGAGGSFVWAHPGGTAAGKLWHLDGDGSLEALRGAVDLAQTPPLTALAFRRAGAIWLGVAKGQDALAPVGEISQARGSGAAVGSPAVAVNGDVVVAAWADRAEASGPWRLRWVTFKAGDAPGEPGTFTPPAGGRGEQAMSPAIAAMPGGRFLLVWTEGPSARHDVRALTLSREGQPIGKPLVVSSKSVNAGQGQAAVNAAGRGAIAFLEAAEGGFRVVALPIKCGR